jgi:hypothetical protein
MTQDEFARLLETYGANLTRWPEEYRDAAARLRGASPEARAKWARAEALETVFRRDRELGDVPGRNAAIVNAALRRIRATPERSFDWRWFVTRRWGTAAAAAVLAGWLAGVILGPVIEPPPERGVSAVAALLGAGPTDFEGFL